jgi:hypothetical protein
MAKAVHRLIAEDRIDLRAIDANSAAAEDQAFVFIGASAFTETALPTS